MAGFHHVELWLADYEEAQAGWTWLLHQVDFVVHREWAGGQSWIAGGAYLTLTTSPNLTAQVHDRRRAGVNHLAFRVASHAVVDVVVAGASAHGWRPLYHDRYPRAGGQDHYAGWLENAAGFKVEIVADAC